MHAYIAFWPSKCFCCFHFAITLMYTKALLQPSTGEANIAKQFEVVIEVSLKYAGLGIFCHCQNRLSADKM